MSGKIPLKNLTGKESLTDVVDGINDLNFLSSRLYKYSDNIYLIVSSRGRVRSFVWADSDAAAKRAVDSDNEAYSGPVRNKPADMIHELNDYTYQGISDWLNKQDEYYQESASYRIAVDGAFVHKQIETAKYSFLFLGENIKPDDDVYAIIFKSNRVY